ncbi:hypothetical protein A2U01_0063184, partial [Trifolium medium]|nr:hypothetical protein [Trifolium medium]
MHERKSKTNKGEAGVEKAVKFGRSKQRIGTYYSGFMIGIGGEGGFDGEGSYRCDRSSPEKEK